MRSSLKIKKIAEKATTLLLVYVPSVWEHDHRRNAFRSLAETLPEHVAVICVDRPLDFFVAPLKRPRQFLSGIWRLGEYSDRERLYVVRPRLIMHEIPAARIPLMTAINRLLLRRQLQQVIHRYFTGVRHIIQWIHHPIQRWVYDVFPDAGRVYHCYDEYACSDDGQFHPERWAREKRVIQEADVTFVTSDKLKNRRDQIARRLPLIPNGIPEYFFECPPLTHDPIEQIPHPRVGYLGHVRPQLDFNLLQEICLHYPDWQMVFVGPIYNEDLIRDLRKLPNVHFLGPRPHRLLPAILQQFDVGLMPFLVNESTRGLLPLKLYEYLAAGVPVVSTNLPNLDSFRSIIRLVPNEAKAFEAAIVHELGQDRATTAARLREVARNFTWTRINREYVIPVLQDVFGL